MGGQTGLQALDCCVTRRWYPMSQTTACHSLLAAKWRRLQGAHLCTPAEQSECLGYSKNFLWPCFGEPEQPRRGACCSRGELGGETSPLGARRVFFLWDLGISSTHLQGGLSSSSSLTPPAAATVRGKNMSSTSPPSPPQEGKSLATELEERCPICLDSWEEPSFALPCLHRFCYTCILRWAEEKPECPLCKRRITSLLHSVRADDDYVEHVIAPPATSPVIVRHGEGAQEDSAVQDLHHPGAPQPRPEEGMPRANSSLEEAALLEDSVMDMLSSHGVDDQLVLQTLQSALLDYAVTVAEELLLVTLQRRVAASPPVPLSSLPEEGASREEPAVAMPRASTSSQGRERSPVGPRRNQRRRASSSEDAPANKRPAPHQ